MNDSGSLFGYTNATFRGKQIITHVTSPFSVIGSSSTAWVSLCRAWSMFSPTPPEKLGIFAQVDRHTHYTHPPPTHIYTHTPDFWDKMQDGGNTSQSTLPKVKVNQVCVTMSAHINTEHGFHSEHTFTFTEREFHQFARKKCLTREYRNFFLFFFFFGLLQRFVNSFGPPTRLVRFRE